MIKTLTEKKHYVILGSFFLLLFIILLSIRLGSVEYSFNKIFEVFFQKEMTPERNILFNIRLPRIIVAILVGANLAVAGALLQAVMQNPLADPGLTGVSSGASLVAIIIMLVFPSYSYLVPIGAFIGGAIACFAVYILAWKDGIKPIRIILAGVAINAILGGGTSLLSILNSDRIQGVLLWVNGSMSGKNWSDARVLIIYSSIGLFLGVLCIRKANILQLGDEMASNLGVSTNKYRVLLSLVAVFLAGISTAVVGVIGFVGLIVPHIARLLIGSDYKYLLPFCIVLGSCTLLLGDTFARTIMRPVELPVGVIMAIIGGPFFLYLLRRGRA
ncbi:iron complex transport system permease protein [Natranaerovirga hydrolytica]|uniref:Iron complex transport system permease protein n=1 Tax=Natranaerovirga hydrolytica TaxID=680378 RepID=A0A4R1MND7_9FIRM|nr:iron ABC transporter permease [Natranaerovirga hydrolytica]TCK92814.1 iron complex transport system permease protein [Natranaerovirga hydrolytica]